VTIKRRRHRWEGNIKKCLRKIVLDFGKTGLICQDRDQWRAIVNSATKSSGCINCCEIGEQLNNYQLLKKNSAPSS
jgi:hypothetical protein